MSGSEFEQQRVRDLVRVSALIGELEQSVQEYFDREKSVIVEREVFVGKGTLLHSWPKTRRHFVAAYGEQGPYLLRDGRIGYRERIGRSRYAIVAKPIAEFAFDIAYSGQDDPVGSIAALEHRIRFFKGESE